MMFAPNIPIPKEPQVWLKLLEVAIELLPKIAKLFVAVGKVLGLIDDDKKPEEIGDKALQAEEADIRPENYDSYQDYIKAVNDFELNPEKSQETNIEDKLKKTVEIVVQGLDEKYPEANFEKLLEALPISEENQEFFTVERFVELAEIVAEDPEIMDLLGKLLTGEELAAEDYIKLMEKLVEVEKKINPQKTEEDIKDYLRNLG